MGIMKVKEEMRSELLSKERCLIRSPKVNEDDLVISTEDLTGWIKNIFFVLVSFVFSHFFSAT